MLSPRMRTWGDAPARRLRRASRHRHATVYDEPGSRFERSIAHRLRLGTHEFVTVPGEPTTVAGFRMEGDALGRPGVSSASLIGYSGDYAGYFTTAEEYALQHYEGAHTLYGEPTLDLLRAAVGAPSPMPPPGASLP